jgi:hypothetical protein
MMNGLEISEEQGPNMPPQYEPSRRCTDQIEMLRCHPAEWPCTVTCLPSRTAGAVLSKVSLTNRSLPSCPLSSAIASNCR